MSEADAWDGDPATSAHELARLAREHPELHAAIAAHRAAYPELLTWIAEHGDAGARAAATRRLSALSPVAIVDAAAPTPAVAAAREAPAPRRRIPALGLGLGGVAAVAVAAVVIVMSIVTSSSVAPPPTSGASPAAADPAPDPAPLADAPEPLLVADLRRLPIAPVAVRLDDPTWDVAAVQRFADDVAAGDAASLVSKCWTFAPDTILDRYASEAGRGAVLDALGRVGQMGQFGAVWTGELVSVAFSWYELESTYACPLVTILGVDDAYSPVDAAWFINRLAGRLAGTPVSAGDTEENYPMLCSDEWAFSPDGFTPPVWVDPAPVNAAVLALAGQPVEVTRLAEGGGDYYEVSAPGVDDSLVLLFRGVFPCVGDVG